MKILLINNGFPTRSNPHHSTYIRTIACCLSAAGHHVRLLAIHYDGPPTRLRKAWKYIVFWFATAFADTSSYEAVYVHHLPFAWPLLLNHSLRSEKLCIHWHGGELVGDSLFLRTVRRFAQRRVGRCRHIVPSQYFRLQLTSRLGIDPHLISVSPSGGVDTHLFSPSDGLPGGLPHGHATIGFASALTTAKGAGEVLNLMRVRSEIERAAGCRVTFHVIDYGGEADSYKALFRQAAPDTIISSRTAKCAMPSFYRSLTLLLMLSSRESLGLAALEAMSCGVPVVSFDICAFPEFVIGGVSGERAALADDTAMRTQSVAGAAVRVLKGRSSYKPRRIVEERYSEASVVEFYREYFSSDNYHE